MREEDPITRARFGFRACSLNSNRDICLRNPRWNNYIRELKVPHSRHMVQNLPLQKLHLHLEGQRLK